ncbi:hypothetical protein PTKIN_Ptkin03bG0115500 [Pterospermum kingtungense]
MFSMYRQALPLLLLHRSFSSPLRIRFFAYAATSFIGFFFTVFPYWVYWLLFIAHIGWD